MTFPLTSHFNISPGLQRCYQWLVVCVFASMPFPAAATTIKLALGGEPLNNPAVSAMFYSDSSCLLNIAAKEQAGTTAIDAGVDDNGSRVMIHCDTSDGHRLTLQVFGDAINLYGRHPLLNTVQAAERGSGVIAWITVSAAGQSDTEQLPLRYVNDGQLMLRKTPVADFAGAATNASRQVFARVDGTLDSSLTYPLDEPRDNDSSLSSSFEKPFP